MQRERVAEDIYVFASDLYAQVTATVIVTTEGAVLFDTLLYPEEARLIKQFVEHRLRTEIRYVINSHFHADHTSGTCFFPGAEVIAHVLCRDLLDQRGRDSLERAKVASPEMRAVELVLPTSVFETNYLLQVGNKTLELWSTPGHSPDLIVCHVKEDRVFLGADTVMPLPHFVDGSFDDLLAALETLSGAQYENVIQGHGEVILRGEIGDKLRSDIDYLHLLDKAVDAALHRPMRDPALAAINIESCGKSPVLLNGAAVQLHHQNVLALANQRIVEAS